jgi:hypothetical protein
MGANLRQPDHFEPFNPLECDDHAIVGNYHRRERAFGPHSADASLRPIAMFEARASFRGEGRLRLGDEANDRDLLAAFVVGWPG